MDQGVAGFFRPSIAAKKAGMFTRTCRVMKRKKERKRMLSKRGEALTAPAPTGIG